MASISVTQNAWRKMAEIILKSKHNLGFIYSASSGGCNGFNFELNLIQQKEYENIKQQRFYTVLTNKDTKLYIDPVSEMILHGTTVDYISENYKEGIFESKFNFKINKELMTSCGCGISFTPKGY
tara:strand:- start:773 stop:1147 length:375 start_codon:yes stop_codon:yes gene_type:complete